MPRKKKAVIIPETTTTQPAQIEETPESQQLVAKPTREPKKPAKTASVKAKRPRQDKNKQIEQGETPPVDKRQMILPDAENLFQAESLGKSENQDEPATDRATKTVKEMVEPEDARLPAQERIDAEEQPATRPMALKLSVSLYEKDVETLDKIREYLRGYGVRKLTDSEAIRIAIRATTPEARLIEIHEQLKTDDRRRKQRQQKDNYSSLIDDDRFMLDDDDEFMSI